MQGAGAGQTITSTKAGDWFRWQEKKKKKKHMRKEKLSKIQLNLSL